MYKANLLRERLFVLFILNVKLEDEEMAGGGVENNSNNTRAIPKLIIAINTLGGTALVFSF